MNGLFNPIVKRMAALAPLLAIIASLATPLALAQPVKLAIIPRAETLKPAADFLTSALSTNHQIALVEREQLDKVLREQSLAAGNSGNALRLGELLGADGLLFLQETDDSTEVVVILVAVKPGVTLRQNRYPWPSFEPAGWADTVARQMRDLFPKLGVLSKSATPLSILNLRASVNSPAGIALERELTHLLYDRLVREREIFILERRDLQTLAQEKELKGLADVPFWSGGYLLEGVINKAGFDSSNVTISGRIVPPDKTNFIPIEISGTRTNLVSFIDALGKRILSVLKTNAATAEWNGLAEAERYFEEAQWAYRWGMWREAGAAAEASWALGKRSADLGELRIKAWRDLARDPGKCVINRDSKRVYFGRPFFLRFMDIGQMAEFGVPPDAERLSALIHSVELYQESIQAFARADNKVSVPWFTLGTGLLDRAGSWLRYFYFTYEARVGHKETIANLKRLSLELGTTLARFSQIDSNHSVLGIQARYAAFVTDSPEQTIDVYRKMVAAGNWPFVRTRFLNEASAESRGERVHLSGVEAGEHADLASPCLAGWTWSQRQRCPALWTHFVGELCQSTNLAVQLEGRYLRCSHSWRGADFRTNLHELLGFVWQERARFAAPTFAPSLLNDLGKLLESRTQALGRPPLGMFEPNSLADEVWDKFRRDFAELQKGLQEAAAAVTARQERALWLESEKNYLRTQDVYEVGWFTSQLRESFDRDEARELLDLLLVFKSRLDATNTAAVGGQKRERYPFYATVERKLREASSPSKTAVNPPLLASSNSPPKNFTATKAPFVPTNILHASRFWAIPSDSEPLPGNVFRTIGACSYRDGRLWVLAGRPMFSDEGCFFSVDLDTFRSETIKTTNVSVGRSSITGGFETTFDVFQGSLYVCFYDHVLRYDLARRTWEPFPLPVTDRPRVARLGDRLFFATETSIMEYTGENSFRLLASTRRRPPVTVLDSHENYGRPSFCRTPSGEIRTAVQNVVYALTGSNEWRRITDLPSLPGSSFFEQGILSYTGGPMGDRELWALRGDDTAFQLLLLESAAEGRVRSWPGTHPITNAPSWRAPLGTRILHHPKCIQGDSMWFFVPPAKPGQTNSWQSMLLRYTLGDQDGLCISVEFPSTHPTHNPILRDFSFCEATPKGLILNWGQQSGFWLISNDELQVFVNRHEAERKAEFDLEQVRRNTVRRELFAVFDKDKNGLLSASEKEAAISNPRFLDLELRAIDANHNDLLDASEVGFFDANDNGALEPNEYDAIQVTLTNLASRLLSKLDRDANGRLERGEFPPHLYDESFTLRSGSIFGPTDFQFANRVGNDSGIDQETLTRALRQHLFRDLRKRIGPGFAAGSTAPGLQQLSANAATDALLSFIEEFWRRQREAEKGPLTNSTAPPKPLKAPMPSATP